MQRNYMGISLILEEAWRAVHQSVMLLTVALEIRHGGEKNKQNKAVVS
jgi:hypothetical protein